MVSAVSNNGTTNTLAGTAEASQSAFANNFDTFLKLLTTQLQNQDPLSPLDTNEFTNQIVSFSQVEQAINSNKKLDQLIKQNANSEISNSVNYVGKSVEVRSGEMVLSNNGGKTFGYELDKPADEVEIIIKNSAGTIVYKGEGLKEEGRHDVSWDRLDGNGNFLPAGEYTVTVSARYKNSESFSEIATFTNGVITGVNMDGTEVTSLLVDGTLEIPLKDVNFVGASPASTTNATPSITNFAGEVIYNNNGPVTVDDNVAFFDKDNDVLAGVIVALENRKNGDKEVLNVTLEEGITIESNKDGIMVLTGVATKEAYERVLRSLTYENTAGIPSAGDRNISVLISDGLGTSNKVTKTIKYNIS